MSLRSITPAEISCNRRRRRGIMGTISEEAKLFCAAADASSHSKIWTPLICSQIKCSRSSSCFWQTRAPVAKVFTFCIEVKALILWRLEAIIFQQQQSNRLSSATAMTGELLLDAVTNVTFYIFIFFCTENVLNSDPKSFSKITSSL